MRHSDQCRQGIIGAVEADDEGRMRTFWDMNALKRLAPEVAGKRGAAPVVAALQVETEQFKWSGGTK